MCIKIFLSGWKHTNDSSLHMVSRELFKEAMCAVGERLNARDEFSYVHETIYLWKETNQRCTP